MTLQEQTTLAKNITRLLKVRSVSFPIANTDKGPLSIKYTQGQEEYEVILDAVPLKMVDLMTDDNNIELKAILEKYLFNNVN